MDESFLNAILAASLTPISAPLYSELRDFFSDASKILPILYGYSQIPPDAPINTIKTIEVINAISRPTYHVIFSAHLATFINSPIYDSTICSLVRQADTFQASHPCVYCAAPLSSSRSEDYVPLPMGQAHASCHRDHACDLSPLLSYLSSISCIFTGFQPLPQDQIL
jgi:hypothetical protein